MFTAEEAAKVQALLAGTLGKDSRSGGPQWTNIALKLPGRDATQVRNHFVSLQHAMTSKTTFTAEEDVQIQALLAGPLGKDSQSGGPQWTKIALTLPGRDAKQVRDRCASLQNRPRGLAACHLRLAKAAVAAHPQDVAAAEALVTAQRKQVKEAAFRTKFTWGNGERLKVQLQEPPPSARPLASLLGPAAFAADTGQQQPGQQPVSCLISRPKGRKYSWMVVNSRSPSMRSIQALGIRVEPDVYGAGCPNAAIVLCVLAGKHELAKLLFTVPSDLVNETSACDVLGKVLGLPVVKVTGDRRATVSQRFVLSNAAAAAPPLEGGSSSSTAVIVAGEVGGGSGKQKVEAPRKILGSISNL